MTKLPGRAMVMWSLLFGTSLASIGTVTRRSQSVPLCSGVSLSASYLAVVGKGQEPGFRFSLSNHTGRAIRLVEPVPSSSHWYARARGRWLWRASNGAGGSLLDAGQERGRLVVYPSTAQPSTENLLILLPHQSKEWVASAQDNPVLAYQPGCNKCSYPGESEYQVVFAYAYVAGGDTPAGLLPCGLRSAPVPMPPKF